MITLKKNDWQVLCFYICALLFYPLVWPRLIEGRLIYWSELNLFTSALIAVLCCSLLLFNSKKLFTFFSSKSAKLVAAAFAFILLISLIQLTVCYNGRFSYLWSSVYWIAVPLFCAVNRREIEKYLPFFMVILGTATAIQSFQEFSAGRPLVGIPGNWNWNASLIAVTVPFVCLAVHKYLRRYYKKILCLIASLLLIFLLVVSAAVLMFYCKSKAAFLGLAISCAALLVLRYWRKFPRIYWLGFGLLLIVFGGVFLYLIKGYISNYLQNDQRLFLWFAALDLTKDNLLFGCGPELFESMYAPYISADYYFGKFVSARHNHAHNHFLYFAATMGIPALIAWGSVMFYAVGKNLCRAAEKTEWQLKLYLFVFILLFVHSMLDIVVVSWPLGCIFLIILGILLGRALEDARTAEAEKNKFITSACSVAAVALMILLINYLYFNFLGTMHYRRAKLIIENKEAEKAFAETEKSIAAMTSPQNTYLAAMISLYDFKNPKNCLKFLDRLNSLGFANYESNNLLRAKALAASGKMQESLLYFAREQQNFPLSCVNLYYYRMVLIRLGKKQQAADINKSLQDILKMKGFDEKKLPELLKNPIMDLRFRYYNGDEK